VLWQRLSILSDIAQVAPMLGLLGTVMGMFYAFYDMNRSVESISQVFDGLGIAVATTVAGLVVSIVAVALHSILRFRLTRLLTLVESEVLPLAHNIDHAVKPRKSSAKEKTAKGADSAAPELAGLLS
jgi:biopolymer transport protein ExbB